jgi:hypothetical protein
MNSPDILNLWYYPKNGISGISVYAEIDIVSRSFLWIPAGNPPLS